jgi:GNAT superfamily N-acetyltransferase
MNYFPAKRRLATARLFAYNSAGESLMSSSEISSEIDLVTLPIHSFDIKSEDETLLRASHDFQTLLEQERAPEDPTTRYEQRLASLRSIPSFVDVYIWHISLPDGRIIAEADIALLKMEENAHMGQFQVSVLPEFRCQGLGKRLFRQVLAIAEQNDRRLLITGSSDRVPAGAEFMHFIGAKPGMESHVNQLTLAEIDPELLSRWSEIPEGFTPGWWEGAYPESDIEEIVELNELMNQVPRGDMDVEDFHWTAEHLRQQEKSHAAVGIQRWSLYVRHNESGKIAGYTEVFWNPNKPMNLGQGITAVWPQYRGSGIGRFLKAAMLTRVRQERPEVLRVRTDNADMNAPMLKINTELGFKPYIAETVWQVDVPEARKIIG